MGKLDDGKLGAASASFSLLRLRILFCSLVGRLHKIRDQMLQKVVRKTQGKIIRSRRPKRRPNANAAARCMR